MSKYFKKKRRSKKEKIGFYTSLSICIIAMGMAAYSTYTNFAEYMNTEEITQTAQVNNIATGVTDTLPAETETESYTTEPTVTEQIEESTSVVITETQTAVQTMLSVNANLSYPLNNSTVIKEYSEDTVYNKTLNQWNAHTGVDFSCKAGDNVYSMSDGEVVKIYNDDMLGNIIVIESSNYKIYYCGLSEKTNVSVGDVVKQGDVIALASVVPSESLDDSHIHIEVKVGDSYIDPLTVINNDE